MRELNIMKNDDLELRVNNLETKLAYQEAAYDELDLQMQKLNSVVEKLEQYCAKLEQQVVEIQDSDSNQESIISNEPPPHY